jgi:O-antigen ligase
MSPKKISAARFLLWLGAFAPIIYTVPKTVDDIGGTSGVGWLDTVRGGGGLVCYVLARALVPTTVRNLRIGVPEIALLLFIAVGFLSVTWSVSPLTTFLKMIPLAATYLCMTRVTGMYESPEAALHSVVKVVHVILLSTFLQFVISPSATYSADPLEPLGPMDPIPRLNSNIPAVSANILGVVIGIGLAGIISKFGPKWTCRQPTNFLLFGTYGCMLVATRSRMITVVVLVIAVLLLWKAMQSTSMKAGVGWLTVGCLVSLFWVLVSNENAVWSILREFLLRGQEGGTALTTLTGRTVLWERAIPLWLEHPWTGYGYYSGHRLGLAAMDSLFIRYSNLDNTWVETLVDVGAFGASALFLFAILGLMRVARTAGWGGARPIAILVALCVIVMSFVNPTIQSDSTTLIFFAALVFSSRVERIQKQVFQPAHASILVTKYVPKAGLRMPIKAKMHP